MISIWMITLVSAARTGAGSGSFSLAPTLAAVGEVAKPLAGVVVGFALARVTDMWRARPHLNVVHVQVRSLYAHHFAGMSKRAWAQCGPDTELGAHVLVVINAMVNNASTDDDAVMRAEVLVGGYEAPAQESMVEAFQPVAVKAHGIESVRMVFELPRSQLGDELWAQIQATSVTLRLTTVRRKRYLQNVPLGGSFIEQHFNPIVNSTTPPPIRGYTEVLVQDGVYHDTTYFGSRRRFNEHELW